MKTGTLSILSISLKLYGNFFHKKYIGEQFCQWNATHTGKQLSGLSVHQSVIS